MTEEHSNPPGARILIVGQDAEHNAAIQRALDAAGYLTYVREDAQRAFDVIYNEPPNAIILQRPLPGTDAETFSTDLKSDNVFSHLPIMLLLPHEELAAGVDWRRLPVDDFLPLPVDHAALVERVAFLLERTQRELGSNPLTRLPGNDSIIAEIQQRLDRETECAIVYVDVDNFKAFNDAYGFTRGDEVLRMIARVLINAIRSLRARGGYVGHVGGDDFVLTIPLADAEGTCAQIIGNFDLIVPTFYHEADRTRGHIEGKDRQGNPTRFPLMSLTLAVIPCTEGRYRHYGEVSTVAAELKKFGKQQTGSNYVVDRRDGAPDSRTPEQ